VLETTLQVVDVVACLHILINDVTGHISRLCVSCGHLPGTGSVQCSQELSVSACSQSPLGALLVCVL